MSATLAARLDRAVARLPAAYAGPGGAVAVLQQGELVARHAWGWANAEQRTLFTPATLFRMCSITKQFTCGLLLEAFPDLTALDSAVASRLPQLQQAAPSVLHLCHNQSGLRDYWAVAMLHGSPVEAPFGTADATRLVAGTRTLQFAPGTRFSYCNQNFRLLADILQERTGRSFAELLRAHIFDRVGMPSAFLAADTRAMPDGTEGYEGSQVSGFRVARNRIHWTGDAGLGASLDDMIAWERHVDASRDDPRALYGRLAAAVQFADGTAAEYGFGLNRRPLLRRAATGHGGALRGWRSHRCYLPNERVSVVVLLNHMSDAAAAVTDMLQAVFDEPALPDPAPLATPGWLGAYREPETGLTLRVDMASAQQVRLRYTQAPELLDLQQDGSARGGGTVLRHSTGGLWMDRAQDHQSSCLQPLVAAAGPDVAGPNVAGPNVAGRYRCAELDAELTVVNAGGALYGGFSGMLGQGRMELLEPVGADHWTLPCPRALDWSPPGDWTLAFQHDGSGRSKQVEVGCWLARRLTYVRLD